MKEKQCEKQNIFNNKIERSDQKANSNTSAEIKISQNLKQDTSSEKNKFTNSWNQKQNK